MFSIFPQRYCFSEKALPLQGIKTDEMSLKQHIPNTITCGNLVSGCLSILFVASGMPVKAAIMIFVAGLFDFLDGFAARMLHAHSPIGADLDSLSDVVSFGVAPGFIMYWLMSHAQHPEIMLFGLDLSNSTSTTHKRPLFEVFPPPEWPFSSPLCLWLSAK